MSIFTAFILMDYQWSMSSFLGTVGTFEKALELVNKEKEDLFVESSYLEEINLLDENSDWHWHFESFSKKGRIFVCERCGERGSYTVVIAEQNLAISVSA